MTPLETLAGWAYSEQRPTAVWAVDLMTLVFDTASIQCIRSPTSQLALDYKANNSSLWYYPLGCGRVTQRDYISDIEVYQYEPAASNN